MTTQEFDDAIEQVTRSGALGRSAAYSKLLRYLGDCSREGRMPKELDIAVEVFDRSEGFDPSQDSMVRVYVHNLRQKLDAYYEQHPDPDSPRLEIPKGQYRLVLRPAESHSDAAERPQSPWAYAAAAIVIGVVLGWWIAGSSSDNSLDGTDFASAPIWNTVLDDDLPVTLVTGDYFMYAEVDDNGIPGRLIRDFQVNSSADLRRMQSTQPDTADSVADLDLTYLPVGSAPAVADLMRVLTTYGKDVTVVPASKLQIDSLRESHVVYVGYLSGLGPLAQFVFSASGLAVGHSFDELIVIETGERFVSEAAMAANGETQYIDYGYVSAFPGPEQGAIVIVAGTRDEGLMQSSNYMTNAEGLEDLGTARESLGLTETAHFEVLLEVSGFDRSHLDAERVHAAPTISEDVWTVR